jgi:hypothetical protein
MAGFGTMSAGLGPFGLGSPASASLPPEGAAGCRWINPVTRSYEQDEDTRQFKQMPSVRQRVYLAIATLLGSSSTLTTQGIRLPQKMGDSYEGEVKAAVALALRQMTDIEKVLRIDGVTVLKGRGQRSRTTVSFTDLTTGKADRVST